MFFPFPHTHLPYRFCDRYTKSSVAIEDGDADLDFCDLPLKVPRHQRLAEWFDTVHFGFDAASTVVSAPASPQGAAQISLRIDCIVTSNCSGAAQSNPNSRSKLWTNPVVWRSGMPNSTFSVRQV